jgi:hypoxanthine phosphoribosyltransferase
VTEAEVVADPADLRREVGRLAAEISADHPGGVLLVAVLKGSVPFVADLVRRMTVPVEVDFLAISSYAPDTGRVRIVKDLEADVHGRDVVLIEDLVDTGLTVTYIKGELERRGPASLRLGTLLDKSVRRIVPVEIDYRGFEVPDRFVVGYGLDFEERYRNLDRVVAADLDQLRAERDAPGNWPGTR